MKNKIIDIIYNNTGELSSRDRKIAFHISDWIDNVIEEMQSDTKRKFSDKAVLTELKEKLRD